MERKVTGWAESVKTLVVVSCKQAWGDSAREEMRASCSIAGFAREVHAHAAG